MFQEDAGPDDSKESLPLFDRVWAFFLVYAELIAVLVLLVLGVVFLIISD